MDVVTDIVEEWRYLKQTRGLRNAFADLHVRPSAEGLKYQVATCVPRPRKDGTPSKYKAIIYSEVCRTPEEAILLCAHQVRTYMQERGWE